MSGSLTGTAILHQRQLSLFIMICHLPANPLYFRAKQALSTSFTSNKSWFSQIRNICLQYCLPHPLQILQNPPSKPHFKKLCKSRIIDYWENKLRQEASLLPSLRYFQPEYCSLTRPHPILWTAGANPYEVAKAIVQCRMLSGRYPTGMLTRHWSTNRQGWCLQKSCSQVEESLEHILLWCPAYNQTRDRLINLWLGNPNPLITGINYSILNSSEASKMQFLLDASNHPEVISLSQLYGDEPLKIIFHLTRSWCFSIHKERSKCLGRWQPP